MELPFDLEHSYVDSFPIPWPRLVAIKTWPFYHQFFSVMSLHGLAYTVPMETDLRVAHQRVQALKQTL